MDPTQRCENSVFLADLLLQEEPIESLPPDKLDRLKLAIMTAPHTKSLAKLCVTVLSEEEIPEWAKELCPCSVDHDNPDQILADCKNGNIDALQKINCSPDYWLALKDDEGNSPLHLAVMKEQWRIAEYLVSQSPQLLEEQGADGQFPCDLTEDYQRVLSLIASGIPGEFEDEFRVIHTIYLLCCLKNAELLKQYFRDKDFDFFELSETFRDMPEERNPSLICERLGHEEHLNFLIDHLRHNGPKVIYPSLEVDLQTIRMLLYLGAKESIRKELERISLLIEKDRTPEFDLFLYEKLKSLGMDGEFLDWIKATIRDERQVLFLLELFPYEEITKYFLEELQEALSLCKILPLMHFSPRESVCYKKDHPIAKLMCSLISRIVSRKRHNLYWLSSFQYVNYLYYTKICMQDFQFAPESFRQSPIETIIRYTPSIDDRTIILIRGVKEAGLHSNFANQQSNAIGRLLRYSFFPVPTLLPMLIKLEKCLGIDFNKYIDLNADEIIACLFSRCEKDTENITLWVELFKYLYSCGAQGKQLQNLALIVYSLPLEFYRDTNSLLVNHECSEAQLHTLIKDFYSMFQNDTTSDQELKSVKLKLLIGIMEKTVHAIYPRRFLLGVEFICILKSALYLGDIKLFNMALRLKTYTIDRHPEWNPNENDFLRLCKDYENDRETIETALSLLSEEKIRLENPLQCLKRLLPSQNIGLIQCWMKNFSPGVIDTEPNPSQSLTGLSSLSIQLIESLVEAGWRSIETIPGYDVDNPEEVVDLCLVQDEEEVGYLQVHLESFYSTVIDTNTLSPISQGYFTRTKEIELIFQKRKIENNPNFLHESFPSCMIMEDNKDICQCDFDIDHPVILQNDKNNQLVKMYSRRLRSNAIEFIELPYHTHHLISKLKKYIKHKKKKIETRVNDLRSTLDIKIEGNPVQFEGFDGNRSHFALQHNLVSGKTIQLEQAIPGIPSADDPKIEELTQNWTNHILFATEAETLVSEAGGYFQTNQREITAPFIAHIDDYFLVFEAKNSEGNRLLLFTCHQSEMKNTVIMIANLISFLDDYDWNPETLKSLTFKNQTTIHQTPATIRCSRLIEYLPRSKKALEHCLKTLLLNIEKGEGIQGLDPEKDKESYERIKIQLTHTLVKQDSNGLATLASELAEAAQENGCGTWISDIINPHYNLTFDHFSKQTDPESNLIIECYHYAIFEQIQFMVQAAKDPEVQNQTRHYRNYIRGILKNEGYPLPLTPFETDQVDIYAKAYGNDEMSPECVLETFFLELKPRLLKKIVEMQQNKWEWAEILINSLIEIQSKETPNEELIQKRDKTIEALRSKKEDLEKSLQKAQTSKAYVTYQTLLAKIQHKKIEKQTHSKHKFELNKNLCIQTGPSHQISTSRLKILEEKYQQCHEIIETASSLLQPLAETEEVKAVLELKSSLEKINQQIEQTAIKYAAEIRDHYEKVLEKEGLLELSDPKDKLSDLRISLKGAARLLEIANLFTTQRNA